MSQFRHASPWQEFGVARSQEFGARQAAGADLAVIQENVNTRSPMGRFIFTLFSALAQLEREQNAERTSTAMLRHHAKGRRMTRPERCPYGWRRTRPTRSG
jgi:DNA invertase Pin-like site-specific DNA recombinase